MSHALQTQDLTRINASDTPAAGDEELHSLGKMVRLLSEMMAAGAAASGLNLPAYDYVANTRIGSTNNISTSTFKTGGSGGTTVAVLTYTYFGAGAADDDTIQTITKT